MDKICTSVKQSRQLIELGMDIGTADMNYMYGFDDITEETIGIQSDASTGFDPDFYPGTKAFQYIPAWSLTALLNYLKSKNKFPNIKELSDGRFKLTTFIWDGTNSYQVSIANNLVDACYELVVKLLKYCNYE